MSGNNKIYIDVRTPEEVSEHGVAGALNIELETFVENALLGKLPESIGDVPIDAELFVFCASGGRAETVVNILKHFGFTNVKNAGGFKDVGEVGTNF